MNVTQNGSSVSATWSGDQIAWSGNMTATVSGASLDGQLSFRGVAADGTVCNGNGTVSGSVSATAIALSGANGIVGGSCPASLPTAIHIDLHR